MTQWPWIAINQKVGGRSEMDNEIGIVHFPNANSRHNYFTVHNIRAAHEISRGMGTNVGILDHEFAVSKHQALYHSGKDFGGPSTSFEEVEGHGYWMACVVKEIAPECRIHALHVGYPCPPLGDPDTCSKAIFEAINWAVDSGIEILTSSHGMDAYAPRRKEIDAAVSSATQRGTATCFLHYDHPDNILPYGTFPYRSDAYTRHPDINIWHYDYNTLFLSQYQRYLEASKPLRSGDEIPYFSMSSTAPVTGAFVALMMAVQPGLPVSAYRQALIDSSYSWSYVGEASFEQGESPRVADIFRAIQLLSSATPGPAFV